MTGPGSSDDLAASQAGWSEVSRQPTEDAALGDETFQVEEVSRYEGREDLGSGGMGIVSEALDRRLGRVVAIKRVIRRDDQLEHRLRREARVLARLDHPAIPPILDAGVDENGSSFYVMPKLQGTTLATRLDQLEDGERFSAAARLSLLRIVIAVSQAVAHAHDHAIVHRDLKPANIMLGEHGEVHVLDWGLARMLSEVEDSGSEDPPSDDGRLTRHGAIMGTPGYQSPEQARGAPTDRRSDVWSLGAVLHTCLHGAPPGQGETRLVEPELEAVVGRALAAAPEERYSDAAALAADLQRYIDGRWVDAHEYSGRDLVRNVWRRYRLPISAAALGLLALFVAGTTVYALTEQARRRAVSAEVATSEALDTAIEERARAEHARDDADAALREILLEQARHAAKSGALARAELLALEALQREESAVARGVLARTLRPGRPRLVASLQRDDCIRMVVDPSGSQAACVRSRELTLFDLDGEDETTLELPEPYSSRASLQLTTRDRIVFLPLDTPPYTWQTSTGFVPLAKAWSGARLVTVSDGTPYLGKANGIGRVDAKAVRPVSDSCSDAGGVVAMSIQADRMLAHCLSGPLEVLDEHGRRLSRLEPLGVMSAVTLSKQGQLAWVAEGRGLIAELDLEGSEGELRRRINVDAGRIRAVVESPAGTYLAVVGEAPWVTLVHRVSGTPLWRLPAARADQLVFPDEETVIVTSPGRIDTWALDPHRSATPRVFSAGAGLSALCRDDEDRFIAAANAAGLLRVWSRSTGGVVADLRWQNLVVKDCAFSPDGQTLAAVGMEGGLQLFDTRTWTRRQAEGPRFAYRRVDYLEDQLVTLPFKYQLIRWHDETCLPQRRVGDFSDAGASPDHRVLAILEQRAERVLLLSPVGDRDYGEHPGVRAVDADETGTLVAVATRHGVGLHAPDGILYESYDGGDAELLDVAVGPNGRYIAAGTLSGRILVWARGDEFPVAILEGHEERTVDLAFADGGATLASASWDETLRLWNLAALDTDPKEALQSAESDWGRSAKSVRVLVDP